MLTISSIHTAYGGGLNSIVYSNILNDLNTIHYINELNLFKLK